MVSTAHRCLDPHLPDSLLTMTGVRALSVDRSVDGALCRRHGIRARGARITTRPPTSKRFAEFVRSPHYGDLLLGNRAYGAWVGSEMVGVAAWSIGEARSPTARFLAVFVHPLVQRQRHRHAAHRISRGRGRGRRLSRAGDRARRSTRAGFLRGARAYRDRGAAWGMPSGRQMPIAFMRKISGARPDIMH